jgi:hypothetical protein
MNNKYESYLTQTIYTSWILMRFFYIISRMANKQLKTKTKATTPAQVGQAESLWAAGSNAVW